MHSIRWEAMDRSGCGWPNGDRGLGEDTPQHGPPTPTFPFLAAHLMRTQGSSDLLSPLTVANESEDAAARSQVCWRMVGGPETRMGARKGQCFDPPRTCHAMPFNAIQCGFRCHPTPFNAIQRDSTSSEARGERLCARASAQSLRNPQI